GDVSKWNVDEDWESSFRLVNNMFAVSGETDWAALKNHFTDKAVFLEVIAALETLEGNEGHEAKGWVRHKVERYMVKDNRLWKVGGNEGVRDRARVECVTKVEARVLAKKQHQEGGHWGRDQVKLALLDQYCNPKLDDSIMSAI
ncbi:hypothetical protein GYMLUDRAFT_135518, partial [Collybiopsis luxurians FD-317 M1]